MTGKEFYRSRTFWFNVLALVVFVAGAFGYEGFGLEPTVAEYGAVLVTIINVILRFVTREPIKVARRR